MNESIACARNRKYWSRSARKFNSPVRTAVVRLVTPTGSPRSERSRSHLSQCQIASELNLSQGTLFNILKDSPLKCYRRIKTNKLGRWNHVSDWSAFILMNHWSQYSFLKNRAYDYQPTFKYKNEPVYPSVDEKDWSRQIATDRDRSPSLGTAELIWDSLRLMPMVTTISLHPRENDKSKGVLGRNVPSNVQWHQSCYEWFALDVATRWCKTSHSSWNCCVAQTIYCRHHRTCWLAIEESRH